MPVDAVVTHHTDGFRSGVARFNELLAERLGVPLLSLHDRLERVSRPLLSFKVSELGTAGARRLAQLLDAPPWAWEVYLHEYSGLDLERRVVAGAQRVLCGNAEICTDVGGLNPAVEELWAPGLVVDDRAFPPVELSVFSFGMAHKIRTDMFGRLRELLDGSGRSYAVFVSAANHETVSLGDAEVVFDEMRELFGNRLYFLGNLSDVAVANWLRATTYFAAFFETGARANNTSVAAALERGAVVITNLDAQSPPHYVHNETVIDVARCTELPTDTARLASISAAARERSRAYGWDELVARVRGRG